MLHDNELINDKNKDMDELKQEIIAFGEENATLRLQLDVAVNNASEFKERIFEQQMLVQELKRKTENGMIIFSVNF